MNWWPWQTKQAPAHTAADVFPFVGVICDNPHLSSPIEDMTLLAARGNVAWQKEMERAQAERLRKRGVSDSEIYRHRATSAEAQAEKFGMALAEIVRLAGRRGPPTMIEALNQIEATAKGALNTP